MRKCTNPGCPCICDDPDMHHELARLGGSAEVDPSCCARAEPTVPASEHQRVQAEAAALLKEVEEWANPGQGMGSGLHAEKWPPLSRAARAEMKALLARCSAAGATLLEEVEGLRAQREAMTDNCHRLISERDAARAESADLRKEVEGLRRERDELCAKVEARPTCDHREAVFRCAGCVARVRERMPEFPLQSSRPPVKPGPASVPWPVAERAWATYAQKYGREQSVERMAQRGGFGWGEMDMFFPGWRDATDAWKRLESESADLRARLENKERA